MSDSIESQRISHMEGQLNEHTVQIEAATTRLTALESSVIGIKSALDKIQNTIKIAGTILGLVIAAGGIGVPIVNNATNHSDSDQSAKILKELLQTVLTAQYSKPPGPLEP
jgi:hypothetical protein